MAMLSARRSLSDTLSAQDPQGFRVSKYEYRGKGFGRAARKLYLELGFQVYGREPQAIKAGGTYVDEDLMSLLLP